MPGTRPRCISESSGAAKSRGMKAAAARTPHPSQAERRLPVATLSRWEAALPLSRPFHELPTPSSGSLGAARAPVPAAGGGAGTRHPPTPQRCPLGLLPGERAAAAPSPAQAGREAGKEAGREAGREAGGRAGAVPAPARRGPAMRRGRSPSTLVGSGAEGSSSERRTSSNAHKY